jgi:hypothetical protein
MEYITGQTIETTEARWTAGNGKEMVLTVLHNARLATNGYLPASTHDVAVTADGEMYTFSGAHDDPQHGYLVVLNGGQIKVRVPAEHQAAVRNMLEMRRANNEAAAAQGKDEESSYQQHRAGVLRMLNQ